MTNNETNIQNPYATTTAASAPPAKRLPHAKRADQIAAVFCLVLSVLSIDFACFGGFRLGFTISYILWLICGAVYLLSAGLRPTPIGIFSIAASTALSVTFALYADGFSKFMIFSAILVLTLIAVITTARANRFKLGGFRFTVDLLRGIFVTPCAYIGAMLSALFSKRTDSADADHHKPAPALVGILCAIPVLIVIIPLLMQADVAFERMLSAVFDNASRFFASLLVGCVLFLFAFSSLMAYRAGAVQASSAPRSVHKPASTVAVNTFLSIIGAVYLVYLFSQLSYFIGGFSGLLPEDYSYSEYAVRGFFEMCAICLINMSIVFATILLSRRTHGKTARSTTLIELFFCIFSLFIVSTGIAKMVLYIRTYGMTKLRLLTSVFMLALACCFVFIALRLFLRNFPYFKATILAVTLIGLIVSFADIDTTIAKYNLAAYKAGITEQMDVSTLKRLSCAAIPEITVLLDDPDAVIQYQAAAALSVYADKQGIDLTAADKYRISGDFREFNLAERRAVQSVRENADKIVDILGLRNTEQVDYGDATEYTENDANAYAADYVDAYGDDYSAYADPDIYPPAG